jgi:FtsZ-binding cell division protein ZapB
MKARKENKVYRISTEQEKQRYLRDGYDIYSDEGELIEYSPQRKISLGQYEEVRRENESLKKANEARAEENESLKKANEALAEENESLKKANEALAEENESLKEQNEGLRKAEGVPQKEDAGKAEPKASGSKAGK